MHADVVKIFQMDGGITPLKKHRFVLFLCPFIKVDVEFEAGKGDAVPGKTKMAKVSRPYFEPEFAD